MKVKQRIQHYIERIRNNNFIKSVLTLTSGVIFAQGINFIGMPIIGRLYSPADIGEYTNVTANAGVIGAVACLGMMTVFMIPEKDEEAQGLSRLVSNSTIAITTLITAILYFCEPIYRIFETEKSYNVLLIVLWLYIILYTIGNICYAYANRQKLYKVMFWNPIIAAAVNIICGIIFGILGTGFLGYSAAHIISFLANIIHLLRHANPYKKVCKESYTAKNLLKKYKRFPMYQMPANIISTLKVQVETQMITHLFSAYSLGMYSMAMKILSIPLMLLAVPINRVYYQEANRRYNNGQDIGDFSFKILKANIKIALIPISLLILGGEWFFAILLGNKWQEAGTFAAILALYQLMAFCASCLSGDFVIIKKNNIELAVAFFNLLCTIVVYIMAYVFNVSVLNCLWMMAIGGILVVSISKGIFFKMTGVKVREYAKFVIMYIFAPVAFCWGIRLLIL